MTPVLQDLSTAFSEAYREAESFSSMSDIFLGFDTSCYTSSVACVDSDGVVHDGRALLDVPKGERGLRQSDAVFQHTKNLSKLVPDLFAAVGSTDSSNIRAIGVSGRPSGRPNSYMPVFLSGRTVAYSIGAALNVPVYEFTHQQGHIRAALVGNDWLIGSKLIAFHLSGGTTDILIADGELNIDRVGGTTDITAGQLIDRLGVRMGLRFPAGKEMEKLAIRCLKYNSDVVLPPCVRQLQCSFSGVETKAYGYLDKGVDHRDIALSVFVCIVRSLAKLVKNAESMLGIRSFLFAGGVASSFLLRSMLCDMLANLNVDIEFSMPGLSSDNAVGAALLAMDRYGKSNLQ